MSCRAGLCFAGLLVLTACGAREDGGLPPVPADAAVTVPDTGKPPVFVFRAEDLSLFEQHGSWRAVVDEGGFHSVGIFDLERREWHAVRSNLSNPNDLPLRETLLPRAPFAARVRVDEFVRIAHADMAQELAGIEVLYQMVIGRVPEVPDQDLAWLTSLGLSLGRFAAGSLTRVLASEALAYGDPLSTEPHLGIDFDFDQPLASQDWGEVWHPPAPPQGVAMLRLELPADEIFPIAERLMDQWGHEPPFPPEQAFAAEVHLLSLGDEFGLMFAFPEEWFPYPIPAGRALPQFDFLQDIFSNEVATALFGREADSLEWGGFREGESVVLGFGTSGFAAALKTELENRRPKPFAERRYRWPRGSIGFLVDLRALQALMNQLAPFSAPQFGGQSTKDQVAELVIGAEGPRVRVFANWPKPDSPELGGMSLPTNQLADAMVSRWVEALLGSLSGSRETIKVEPREGVPEIAPVEESGD